MATPTPVTLFIDQLTAAKGRADRSGTTRTRGATASALALLTPELRRPPARPFCAPVRPVFTIQRRRRREERVETMTFAENQKLPKTKLALHTGRERAFDGGANRPHACPQAQAATAIHVIPKASACRGRSEAMATDGARVSESAAKQVWSACRKDDCRPARAART